MSESSREGLKERLNTSADRYEGQYGWNQAGLFRWLIETGVIGMWDVTFAAVGGGGDE